MPNFADWCVLSRADCSLCETMLMELCERLGETAASQIQVRDIDGEVELERRFGQRVPVLLIDDEVVCCYRLQMERLQPYLTD